MHVNFPLDTCYSISEANINFYSNPFIHPKRKMKEHDFIYILQGNWGFGQDNETYNVTKDNVLILSANHTHFGISPCSPNTKTMYFHVSCNEDFSSDTSKSIVTLNSLYDVSNNPDVKECFSKIVNCILLGKQKKADILFNLLLCELSEPVVVSNNNIALVIQEIIHKNPEKFFSNQEIAEKCNISAKTAETHFKKTFKTSIHQYMLDFKINEAINYFNKFPRITVKEVAYNLGFYDEYHFSKQFKKIMKVSPSHYKSYKSKNLL